MTPRLPLRRPGGTAEGDIAVRVIRGLFVWLRHEMVYAHLTANRDDDDLAGFLWWLHFHGKDAVLACIGAR